MRALVANDNDISGLDTVVFDSLERLFFAVEHTGGSPGVATWHGRRP